MNPSKFNMGVPLFCAWLKRWSGRSFHRCLPPAGSIDSLSLDFNGVVHELVNDMHQYGRIKLPDDELHDRIIEETIEFTLLLVAVVHPTRSLIIAVDGVVNAAKAARQRASRFTSSASDDAENGDGSPNQAPINAFDRNIISPGTSFMDRLDRALLASFIDRRQEYPPKIVYSSHRVFGEGEHKIMSYLRNPNEIEGTRHVVYGLDADLVHLCMLCSLQRPSLSIFLWRQRDAALPCVPSRQLGRWIDAVSRSLDSGIAFSLRKLSTGAWLEREEARVFNDWRREHCHRLPDQVRDIIADLHTSSVRRSFSQQTPPPTSDVISIDDLKRRITEYMSSEGAVSTESAVLNFFGVTLLLGNDFLPRHPSLSRFDDHVPSLLSLSRKLVLVSIDGTINSTGWIELFRALANKEKVSLMAEARRCLESSGPVQRPRERVRPCHPFPVLTDSITSISEDSIEFDYNNFRLSWYAKEFCPNHAAIVAEADRSMLADMLGQCIDDDVATMSQRYIDAIKWNCLYYMGKRVNELRTYPYYSVPLHVDVLARLELDDTFDDEPVDMVVSPRRSPLYQLVAIMPRRSRDLIPNPLVRPLLDVSSPLLDLFPSSFALDLQGKTHDWMAVPLLPHIDMARIMEAVDTILEGASPDHTACGTDLVVEEDPDLKRRQQLRTYVEVRQRELKDRTKPSFHRSGPIGSAQQPPSSFADRKMLM